MKVIELGTAAFRLLECELEPNEKIIVQPGAMASQQVGIIPETKLNGSILKALILKFLGGETFFINHFVNQSAENQKMFITQPVPGDIQQIELTGQEIFLEVGSFLACRGDIQTEVRWAGFASFIAGEGLFKLAFSGHGTVWYGCYGSVIEKEITGDYICDSGHLLMWPSTIELKLKLPAGIVSSFLSREGFVLQLKGTGKVQMQTRSVKGLAQWLNSRFWS